MILLFTHCNQGSLLFTAVSSSNFAIIDCIDSGRTQRLFSESICSEDGLKSQIYGTFVVEFHACLPILAWSANM